MAAGALTPRGLRRRPVECRDATARESRAKAPVVTRPVTDVGRRELGVEQRPDRERRVVQRVDRGDRPEPVRPRTTSGASRPTAGGAAGRSPGQGREGVLRLPMTSAIAYDTGPSISPIRARAARRRRRTPSGSIVRPNGTPSTTQDEALDQEHDDVAEAPAEHGRGAAHRRDPHPLDDAVAHLVDEPEPHERRAEQGGHHEQAGTNTLNAPPSGNPGMPREPVEQRAEQEEVDERLHDAGDPTRRAVAG